MAKNWKNELDEHFVEQKKTRKEIEAKRQEKRKIMKRFMKKEVLPAFEDLKDELQRYKRECDVDSKKDWAALVVRHKKKKEMVYEINVNVDDSHLRVSKSIYMPNDKGKLKLGVEGKIRNPDNSLKLEKITRDLIIADFLESYKEVTRVK